MRLRRSAPAARRGAPQHMNGNRAHQTRRPRSSSVISAQRTSCVNRVPTFLTGSRRIVSVRRRPALSTLLGWRLPAAGAGVDAAACSPAAPPALRRRACGRQRSAPPRYTASARPFSTYCSTCARVVPRTSAAVGKSINRNPGHLLALRLRVACAAATALPRLAWRVCRIISQAPAPANAPGAIAIDASGRNGYTGVQVFRRVSRAPYTQRVRFLTWSRRLVAAKGVAHYGESRSRQSPAGHGAG